MTSPSELVKPSLAPHEVTELQRRIADLEFQMDRWRTKATDRGERIATLAAERDALAAALAARGPCRNCGGKGFIHFRSEADDGSWGPTKTKACKCGGLDPAAILAARDAEQRRQGYQSAVDALDHLLINCCIPPLGKDEGFRQGILRLITWEVQVALDPAVSSDAQALKRQGAIEALNELQVWSGREVYAMGSEWKGKLDAMLSALREAK